MVSCLSSFLPICLIFFLSLQMPAGGTEQFIVLGPTEPIVALLGTDITLPCRLAPMISAENMEVRWCRSEISQAVLVFQNGMEQPGEQLMEYMGRTELINDFITEGRLAVKIYNVQMSDNGEYRCLFKKGNVHQEAILEVKVAGLGSAPQLFLAGYEDGGIQLVCTTHGWFPQPQVQCRDNNGGKLPSFSETQTQDEDGFFHVEVSIVVRDSSMTNVSCSIHNTLLGQEKMSVIDIPEPFFPRTSPWKKALIVILTILGILFGISMFFIWKEKKKLRRLHQKKNEEQEAKEKNREELERRKALYDLGWKEAHIYPDWRKKHFEALTVTLNTNSAHPDIIVTKENNKILIRIKNDKGEENCSVLGQPIISGRYYWEVEVEMGKKDNWCLGICREDVNRSGFISESPEKGFWTIGCYEGKFQAKTDRKQGEECSTIEQIPKRVGIFLDRKAGDISFYNLTNESYLYNFHTAPFSGAVYPYFNIRSQTTSFTILNVPDRTESTHAPSIETQVVSQEQGQFNDLGDKNWNSEDKSPITQNCSPPHYKPASQNTQDTELTKSLLPKSL